jgi:hypothetical protein
MLLAVDGRDGSNFGGRGPAALKWRIISLHQFVPAFLDIKELVGAACADSEVAHVIRPSRRFFSGIPPTSRLSLDPALRRQGILDGGWWTAQRRTAP